jgi:hypothetical protein
MARRSSRHSAQGFNPGNRRPERFALKLKGRQIERTNNGKVGAIVARLTSGHGLETPRVYFGAVMVAVLGGLVI